MEPILYVLLTFALTAVLTAGVVFFVLAGRLKTSPAEPNPPLTNAPVEPLSVPHNPPIRTEPKAPDEAQIAARRIVLDAIQRSAAGIVAESTAELVPLPSEDYKGRLIGREGRNIRAFEQTAGVDLIVDDTPGAVLISTFDPLRREVARRTLLALIDEGKIQPARIEELFAASQRAVETELLDLGRKAAEEAGATKLPPKVAEALGRLRYRTSYAQNVLAHSVEVAQIAGMIAAELGLDEPTARRAGLLHDIGKALGPDWEGPHAIAGMNFLKDCGEAKEILHAVGAHHFEIEPETPEAIAVIVADQISAVRPGARRESLDQFVQRVAALESIANAFEGVESSFAVQAGRELRVIVRPEAVDDAAAAKLAHDVARRIEAELPSNGQVRVTVIRETRIHEVAKPS